MTDATIVNTRKAVRLAILDAVRQEADPLFQAVAGVSGEFISRGTLTEALERVKASPLPSIDASSAEVVTPADIYVDAICPDCQLPTRILIQLSAVLETTREAGSSIKLKAKAKARGHVHHQLALDEAEDGQEELGLDTADVAVEDDADLRPTGEVNVDELQGEAQRSIAEAEAKPVRMRSVPGKRPGPTPLEDPDDNDLLPA